VYSTHFDGIPDQTGICAVISNRGRKPLNWVRLRLRSYGQVGRKPGRWRSKWLYRELLMPGQSVVVEFEHAPHAAQIEITIDGAGTGTAPRQGRPLRKASTCSEGVLVREIQRLNADREPQGVQILPLVRRNHPEIDAQIAQVNQGE
jgi:hypothetical protein